MGLVTQHENSKTTPETSRPLPTLSRGRTEARKRKCTGLGKLRTIPASTTGHHHNTAMLQHSIPLEDWTQLPELLIVIVYIYVSLGRFPAPISDVKPELLNRRPQTVRKEKNRLETSTDSGNAQQSNCGPNEARARWEPVLGRRRKLLPSLVLSSVGSVSGWSIRKP